MSSKDMKDLRKQLRNVVKELLPEILAEEVKTALYKEVASAVQGKLHIIENSIKDTLQEIDKRSKDVQSFLMREAMAKINIQPVASEQSKESE